MVDEYPRTGYVELVLREFWRPYAEKKSYWRDEEAKHRRATNPPRITFSREYVETTDKFSDDGYYAVPARDLCETHHTLTQHRTLIGAVYDP